MFAEERRASQFEMLAIELISALFMILGVAAIAWLFVGIFSDRGIQEATGFLQAVAENETNATGRSSSVILAFLNSFGIVIPALMISFGVYFFRLGIRLRSRQIGAAGWAQLFLLWLGVFSIILIISNTFNAISDSSLLSEWFISNVPITIVGAIFLYAWWWIGSNMNVFEGQVTLSGQSARLAWNLLIPTMAVMLLVAARPLERTFIASLTNAVFAGREEVQFVGFNNYARLLGIRFDNIPCEADADGACLTRDIEIEQVETQTLPIDGAAIREVLNNLAAGESVPGVPRLIQPDQLETIRDVIDDENADIVAAVQSFDSASERPLGTIQLQSILNYINPDVAIDELVSITADTAEVQVTVTDTRTEIVYPSAREVVGDVYREQGFAPVSRINMGQSRLVFSARDDRFMTSIGNTLFFTVIAVALELVLGMIIALSVNSKFAGRGLMRAAMLVPWAIPTVVSARLWEVMLRDNQSGVINHLLINTGLMSEPLAWLANPELQIWSLIFVDVWKTTPFFALLLLAGLQTIPSDIYEAAAVDGANKVRQFFNITLPLLRPTIAVALVFRTLDSIRVFDVFDVLIGKQLQSMSTYNQQVLVENQEFGYASAIGVTIFVIIFIFTVLYVRVLGVEAE